MHEDRWLDVLFGMGDDDFPLWLMAVRSNILLFLGCSAFVGWSSARRLDIDRPGVRREAYAVVALTALAGLLRFLSGPNLLDFGGIPYSRLLLGYKGHFATAQFYSLVYELTARDIEHAILLDRIAGTLTVPLVYLLCRRFERGVFPAAAAFLFAVYPLHVLFSASDVLAVFSLFLTAWSYVLLAGAGRDGGDPIVERLRYMGGFLGLALGTQVRYENALFVLPALAWLVARRGDVRMASIAPALGVFAAFAGAYAFWTLGAGLSFQNPVRLEAGVAMVFEHVLLNPFLAAPALLLATAAGIRYGGPRFALGAFSAWSAALALPIASESGHGASRVFASWLIFILPLAAYAPARWLAAPRMGMRIAGGLSMALFALMPVVASDRLGARHLEILEHEFFKQKLAALPPEVTHVVVPDDDLLRRLSGSTIELDVKYAFTLAGMPGVRERLELVRLTRQLEDPASTQCRVDSCVFFYGLPCFEQRVYPHSRQQCQTLLARYDVEPLFEREVDAAPFMDCSIYIGDQHRAICAPELRRRRFAFYALDRDR